MKYMFQVNNLKLLRKVLDSDCDGIRFGSEFCEHLLPEKDELKEAYKITEAAGKEFTYVTPRLSNNGIKNVNRQLSFLDEKEAGIVFNDFGTLNLLKQYHNIKLHLGRLLVRVPARSPFAEKLLQEYSIPKNQLSNIASPNIMEFGSQLWYEKLFGCTSLDFSLTLEFYKHYGIKCIDMDWLPGTFNSYLSFLRKGANLSLHAQYIPVTIARRCHMARFIGEETPEICSKPCLRKTFILRNKTMDLDFVLISNALFSEVPVSEEEIIKLRKNRLSEIVFTVTQTSDIETAANYKLIVF